MIKVVPNHWEKWIEQREGKYKSINEDTVVDYMRYGNEVRIEVGSRELQILQIPSFEPLVCYELYHSYTRMAVGQNWEIADQYMLLRIKYDEMGERVERQSDSPHLEFKWRYVDPRYVTAKFNEIKTCKVPVWFTPGVERDYMGNDGTNYELAFGGFFLAARYRWWSYYPDEWEPLTSLTYKTIQEFESVLVEGKS